MYMLREPDWVAWMVSRKQLFSAERYLRLTTGQWQGAVVSIHKRCGVFHPPEKNICFTMCCFYLTDHALPTTQATKFCHPHEIVLTGKSCNPIPSTDTVIPISVALVWSWRFMQLDNKFWLKSLDTRIRVSDNSGTKTMSARKGRWACSNQKLDNTHFCERKSCWEKKFKHISA